MSLRVPGSGLLFPVLLGSFLALAGGPTLPAQMGSGMSSGASAGAGVDSGTASGVVSGQVLNASTGLPVPRALVRFSGRAALTSRDGKFVFEQFTEGGGTIQVIKPGYYFSTDPSEAGGHFIEVAHLARPLQLRIYPEALLTGTVTGPDGGPLARIPVSAIRSVFEDNDQRWAPVDQAFTDTHGNFRLPVPAGEYRLETRYAVVHPGASEVVLPLIVPDESSSNESSVIRIHSGEEQHFDLRPSIGRTHTVTVALESSEMGSPQVNVRSANGSVFPVNTVRNGDGRVYTMDLPSGTYTLSASMNGPDGVQEAESSVTVADRDVAGVVLRFVPVPTLPVEMVVDPGVTSDNSKPSLQQLGLMLKNDRADSEHGGFPIRLSTQRDRVLGFTISPGSYRFEARGNGDWYVRSATYGDTDLLSQSFVVAPGAGGTTIRVTVSNQTGSLQGSTAVNGEAAECWIYLVPTSPSAKAVISTRSNPDGRFTVAYLPPGTYQAIAFEHRHSADYRDPATVAAYSTHVRSVSIQAGDKASLDLSAVPDAEIIP